MNAPLPRRDFLKMIGATGAGLAFSSGSLMRAQTPESASSRVIRCGVIGTSNRGLAHVQGFASLPEVEIAAICDVDSRALKKGLDAVKGCGGKADTFTDFRKLLADPSVDAVMIAIPDHWHTPMAILALQAGKAVYLEKPCSHNPREGELLLEAIAKTKGLVQMGNQRRSFPNMRAAIQEIHDGVIGRPYFARAWYVNNRGTIGTGKEVTVPDYLDYELWQGPAPRQPYRDNIAPYNWHWFWTWGTGEALNNGTHEVDICRWALGVDFPSHVTSAGGRYAFEDDWQPPDTQTISWDFPDRKMITWEGRSCNGYPTDGLERGAMIYGTKGAALLEADNYTAFDRDKKIIRQLRFGAAVDGTNTVSSTGPALDRLHYQNFIDTIRGKATLNSPISEGHKSVTMLQLGNIAWRVGRDLKTNPANGHILHDDEASKLWSRDYETGWTPKV